MSARLAVIALLSTALSAGCASTLQRPVLYPNAHLQTTGKAAAEADIERCEQLAIENEIEPRTGRVAKDAAEGAVVGGATAGAWGVVRGDAGSRAAAGAAAGATGAAVRGAMRSDEPDPLYRRFVEKCLRDMGYEVIGWK